eukprot:ANDGO_06021.mRNA.1 Vacuolar protein sorting-associated protein 2 homolog 1
MSFLFGRKKSPKEVLRENKRLIDKSVRELERERMNLQRQEQRLIGEIKKAAKQNQMGAVGVMAKDLVRTRNQITKFYRMKAQMQAVALQIQSLSSTQQMAQAMHSVTGALSQMNKQVNMASIQKIMMEFEKQNEMMDMKDEMMNDAIDDAVGDADDEEETEAVVSQILDEIGLDTSKNLSSVSSAKLGQKQQTSEKEEEEDTGLNDRLQKLRSGKS